MMKTIKPRRPCGFKFDQHGFVKCRMCRCTEIAACNPPCGWEPGEDDLCTTCADVMRALIRWSVEAHHPTHASLIREMERATARMKKTGQYPYNARKKASGR